MARKIEAMHERYGRCAGKFCRDCDHFYRKKWDKTYYKCLAYGDSNASSTEWRVSDPACGLINRPLPENHVPVIRQLVREPRKPDPEPIIAGQINIFDTLEV